MNNYAFDVWVQVLIIQIWMEEDLSALHTLEVTEDDFQGLKQEQGILVDFGGFPAKIITLLQRCLASYHEDPPRSAILHCRDCFRLSWRHKCDVDRHDA